MNTIKVLPLLALVCSLPLFAASPKAINESNLYGNWHCQHEMEDPKTKMKINISYNTHYTNDGKSSGSGTLLFTLQGMPALEYKATDHSTWKIKGDSLILSSVDINFVNVNYPELNKILNINEILPKSINESVQIVALTKNELKVKSRSHNGVYTCSKINK